MKMKIRGEMVGTGAVVGLCGVGIQCHMGERGCTGRARAARGVAGACAG
jgi:hypothetical protein